YEIANFGSISVTEQKQAIRLQSITPGASNLLIIGFNIFRHIVMDHKAHIRLVDTHSKGNSGYNNVRFIPNKSILISHAFAFSKSGMIGKGVKTIGIQIVGQLIHLPARKAV